MSSTFWNAPLRRSATTAPSRAAPIDMPQYDRSPEARYPVAVEQGWIIRSGAAEDNMAAALTIMVEQRGDVRFVHQSPYCPVTEITVSPPRASTHELAGLPEAFVRDNRSCTASTAAVERSIHILRKELGQ
jgi:hypothetical protein